MYWDEKYGKRLQRAATAVSTRQKYCNAQTYINAVKYDYTLLEFVPSKFFNEELFHAAFEYDEKIDIEEIYVSSNHLPNKYIEIWKYIPDNFLTESVLLTAIGFADTEESVEYISKKIDFSNISESFIREAMKNQYFSKFAPKDMLTEKIAINVLKSDYRQAKYFSEYFSKLSFCKKAVKANIKSLKYVPTRYFNKNFVEFLISLDIKNFLKIPKESLTKELCEAVFDCNWLTMQFFPFEFITNDMIKKYQENALKEVKEEFNFIKNAPTVVFDENFTIQLVKENWRVIKILPQELKSEMVCKLALNVDLEAIKYILSIYLKTRDYISALEKKQGLAGWIAQNIEADKLNEEAAFMLVKNDYRLLAYLPEIVKTESICKYAIEKNYMSVKYLPKENANEELYLKILNEFKFSTEFITWLQKKDIIEYFTLDRNSEENYRELKKILECFPEENISTPRCAKKERDLGIRVLLGSEYDNDLNLFVVIERMLGEKQARTFNSFQDFYNYLDGDLNRADLTEYDFDGVNLSDYKLEGAYLSSKFLIEQGKYNGDFYSSVIDDFKEEAAFLPSLKNETIEAGIITHPEIINEKLNSDERRIYYITDIHLNHKIIEKFPNFATFDEIRLFIQKYVKKMMKTVLAKSSEDYLLIGGDVSFCFDISKIFYAELCRYWTPSKIVTILGNHELWDFNCVGQKTANNSLEDTIEKYKCLFSKLGICFLQNTLLIRKQHTLSIISEEDILNKSVDELRSMAMDSNLIVFGGIGFSAYNQNFDATQGIYRGAITSLERDLQYTQQSELIYNKLQETFYSDKVIVLSHMPPKDWSKRELVPNWIYVNGHTHGNFYTQSDECTVYADNQVGYTSKSVILKYFKTSFYYDIFKYYSDGIYHITKSQYIEFNNGNGTRCSFNKEIDYIVMIKRQGIYLFLLEDKDKNRLYLLNGGVTNRLKVSDLNYYYDNMLKYSEYIKLGMKKYNEALKSISESIKKIGGVGTIHGCIVDINFYNHIYLNPQDGSISAYYSPWFGNRYEYSTIEKLLEKQLPELYAKYKNLIGASADFEEMSSRDISLSQVTHILDTTQYKPSRLIKRLQYITESNVIRIWSDEFIVNYNQHITENEKLLI